MMKFFLKRSTMSTNISFYATIVGIVIKFQNLHFATIICDIGASS